MKRLFKYILYVLTIVIGLFLISIIVILLPPVQNYLIQQTTDFISTKTGAHTEIQKIRIGITGSVILDEFLILDQQSDTLIHCGKLDVNLGMTHLLRNKLYIKHLKTNRINVAISRDNQEPVYNYQFILDSLSGTTDSTSSRSSGSSEWQFYLNKVSLHDTRLVYDDVFDSIKLNLSSRKLLLNIDDQNLQSLDFNIRELVLENTNCSLSQYAKSQKLKENSNSTVDSLPPLFVKLNKIRIRDVEFTYENLLNRFKLETGIPVLDGNIDAFNLSSQIISVGALNSKGVYAHIKYATEDSLSVEDSIIQYREPSRSDRDFVLNGFGWDIKSEELSLENSEFSLINIAIPSGTDFFNTGHMDLRDITFHISDVEINDRMIEGHLSDGYVHPENGPEISGVSTNLLWTDRKLVAGDTRLKTNRSLVSADVQLSFANLFDFNQWHKSMEGFITVDPSYISPGDISYFINDTMYLKNLDSLSEKVMFGLSISGKPGNYQLENLNISSGMGQYLEANGGIVLSDSQQVSYKLNIDTMNISEIYKVSAFFEKDLFGDMDLPDMIDARIHVAGMADSVHIESCIQSEAGDADLAGVVILSPNDMKLLAIADLKNVALGKIFRIDNLGNGTARAEMDFFIVNNEISKGTMALDVKKIPYNAHDLGPINLNGKLYKDEITYHLNSLNPDMLMSAIGDIDITDSVIASNFYARIENCDLEILDLVNQPTSFSTDINWEVEYANSKSFFNSIYIDSMRIEKNDHSYLVPSLQIDLDSHNDVHNIDFKSDMVDAYFHGNMVYEEFETYLYSQFDTDLIPLSTDTNNKFFEFAVDLKEPDFFKGDLVNGLNEIDISDCHGEYRQEDNVFLVQLNVPKFSFNQLAIDSLIFHLDDRNSLNQEFSISKISFDTFSVSNISLNSSVIDDQITSRLTILGETPDPDYSVGTLLTKLDSSYHISLVSDSLILNGNTWEINEENFLRISNNKVTVHNTELRKGDELVKMRYEDSELVLQFTDFNLGNISGFIDSRDQEELFEGNVNGELAVNLSNIDISGIRSDMLIHDLVVHEIPMGSLELVSGFKNDTTLSVLLKNTEKDNMVSLEGMVLFNESEPRMDMNLNLDLNELKYFNRYTKGSISELRGVLTADFDLTDEIRNPVINGYMNLRDVSMRIDPINTVFRLTDERIEINRNVLKLLDFTILDSLQNPLLVDGIMDISEFDNPGYDLSINSEDFQFINSTADDNETFYGQLWMDLGIEIKGNSEELNVNTDFNVLDKTNMAYVMEGDNLELESDEGIVIWGDADTDQQEQVMGSFENAIDSVVSQFTGVDFNSKLTIDKEAQFTIITNPFSGDYLTFKMDGFLNYNFNDEEKSSLIGVLDFNEGKYQLSFYGLVKKEFAIEPGSSIRWSGPIMDGVLNLTAKHIVNTNSVGLMSTEIITDYERARYSQRFPYEVNLGVNGIIDNPGIRFGIDLPERYKHGYPDIGSKLDRLNQDSEEGERNKQVFALLVVGAFLAENTDDGSGSGAGNVGTTAARNSINGILTQQLNNMTGQGFMGFDLNLGVNTFDDYATGSAQSRTQLDVQVSRKLFNDRVTVEAETTYDLRDTDNDLTGYNTSGLMEFSVFYDLTKEGNYRIKAFRENAYDLLDGEIQNTGVSFIMMKEFDKKLKEQEAESELNKEND